MKKRKSGGFLPHNLLEKEAFLKWETGRARVAWSKLDRIRACGYFDAGTSCQCV